MSHIESLNPLNILARGYSITTLAESKVPLRDTAKLAPGQPIETVLANGKIESRVERVEDK
jgi:exonuclease VII large subunit